MADPITKTVEIDGEEHQVEVDPSEHGLLTKDEFKSRMSEEVKRRVEAAKRNAREGRFTPEELAEDEELQQELRAQYPELFQSESSNGDGEGEGQGLTEEDLKKFEKTWEKKKLQPVQEKAEQFAEEARQLRVEKLDREVTEAAQDLGVRKGVRDLLKPKFRDEFEWSEEHQEWFRTDGDGFEMSYDEDSDSRYVTVEEYLRRMKESGDYADLFESSTRSGAGFGGESGGGGSPPKTKIQEMSEQEKMDFIDEHGFQAYQELVHESYQGG